MNVGSLEVECWGGDYSVKGKFVPSNCMLHYMRLFLLGMNASEDTDISDLGALGDFVPVDERTSVSYLDVPYSLKKAYDIIVHNNDKKLGGIT